MAPSRPDIARIAGTNPLNSASETETSDSDGEMGSRSDREGDSAEKRSTNEDLVNTAANALRAARDWAGEDLDAPVEPPRRDPFGGLGVKEERSNFEEKRRSHVGRSPSATRKVSNHIETSERAVRKREKKRPDEVADVLVSLKERSPTASSAETREHERLNGHSKEDSLATSPKLRDHTIPISQTSPQQTLPALQPPSKSSSRSRHSASSPQNDKPNLPSLDSQLKKLAEAAENESHQSNDGRVNGVPSQRQSFSAIGGVRGQSPPGTTLGMAPQDRPRVPVPYMTTSQRQQVTQTQVPNGQHPPNQSSPISSYSENSAQEAFRYRRELPSLSPPPGPGNPGSHPYYSNRKRSQASEHGLSYSQQHQTESPYPPQPSSEGPTHRDRFSPAVGGPSPDQSMDLDGHRSAGRAQRQHSGSITTGVFKCDVPGCPAPAFQTQYLLK
ncbi:MAG: hypothetical protein M1837_002823 [Sclerophora amabilis]|nr:MAG: hypothetical protein M1837_002823 [Sclerophora amabilis]